VPEDSLQSRVAACIRDPARDSQELPIEIAMKRTDTRVAGSPADRRRSPDRRLTWRGGRRDSDWMTRPNGALDRIEEATPTISFWRRLLSFARA
jgi:hypothetical protein